MVLNELFNHKTYAFLQHIVPKVLQENMKSVDSLSCSVYVYMHFTTQIYSALKYNVFAEWVILILDNFKMNELVDFWQLHLSALCRFPTLCRHIARNWQIRQFDWIVAIFPLAFICMSSCFLFISFKFLDLSKKKKNKSCFSWRISLPFNFSENKTEMRVQGWKSVYNSPVPFKHSIGTTGNWEFKINILHSHIYIMFQMRSFECWIP